MGVISYSYVEHAHFAQKLPILPPFRQKHAHFAKKCPFRILAVPVGTISNQLDIVDNYSNLVFSGKKQTRRSSQHGQNRPTTSRVQQPNGIKPPCFKRGERNHQTKDCRHATPLQCHKCGYYRHKSRRCQPH